MASRACSVALLIAILLTGLTPMAGAAATPLPLPDSMVAVGDSITQAASSAGSVGSRYVGASPFGAYTCQSAPFEIEARMIVTSTGALASAVHVTSRVAGA